MASRFLFRTFFLSLLFYGLASIAGAYTSADYTNAGLQFYNAKNYTQAVLYLSAALKMDPNDLRALQGRANCYYFLGKNQEALGDYEKILAVSPSGPVSQFVQALRAKLGLPGTASSSAPASVNSEALAGSSAPKPGGLGLRVEPGFMMVDLADFKEDLATSKADAAQIALSDPTYSFSGSVPSSYINVTVEPVVQIGSNLEIGIPFSIIPVGNITGSGQDTSNFSNTISYSIGGFSFGLNGRFLFGAGPVRPFLSAGGLMAPLGISYNNTLDVGSLGIQGSGTFSGTAMGGQAQLGIDIHPGEPFVVSLFGGYQSATADGFKGRLNISGNGNPTTDDGQLVIYDSPNGKKITFVKDSDPALPGFRPLKVDLSGILAGIHLAIFFLTPITIPIEMGP